jgi:MinD-like ATPase involved in chromosome partitioning or flagellar assembly
MAKENKKVANIIVVCTSKGGEGKSLLSMQKIPLLYLDKNIYIFEVDNNNNSKKLIEKSEKINFKTFRVNDGLDALDEVEFNTLTAKDDTINIIDCGGGDDTLKVLEILNEKELYGLTYVVPLTNSISNVDNALATINAILKFDETAIINLVLNRCPSYEFKEIKEKFKALFGNEEFGLNSRIEEFQSKIRNINYILETDLPDIISSKHQYSLIDAYLKAKLIIENYDVIKEEWLKAGKDEYLKNTRLNRINERIYKYCNTFIENFKLD